MLIVIALGGNAVSLPGKEGNIADQFAATRDACRPLADLISQGHQILITHGNGPQVGNVMRRVEIAASQTADRVYPLPLDIVVADTEAGMGYMISQCLMNELASRGTPRLCSTIVTTVAVDPNDPAFANPDKPVGPFMKRESAERHARDDGWQIKEDVARNAWRRVVPSPLPRDIVELPLLRELVRAGQIVIAAGGGGIPVMRDEHGNFRGVEAVIDKDRTSAILAAELGADVLIILTNVETVQRDFGKPSAKSLPRITVTEAKTLISEKQFSPGSMLPKIEAAIDFLARSKKGGAEVLITSCERARYGLAGHTGTRVVRG
ncbi:carbamate kinase [soil metagenome]